MATRTLNGTISGPLGTGEVRGTITQDASGNVTDWFWTATRVPGVELYLVDPTQGSASRSINGMGTVETIVFNQNNGDVITLNITVATHAVSGALVRGSTLNMPISGTLV